MDVLIIPSLVLYTQILDQLYRININYVFFFYFSSFFFKKATSIFRTEHNNFNKNIQFPAVYEPGHEKMCLMSYANNKGADQPAHLRSLISAFVVCCLDSIISLDSIAEILRL